MKKINSFAQIAVLLLLVFANSSILYGDTMNLPNGDIYEGDTKNGKMNGYGIIYHKDGSSTEGKWKEGKIDDRYIKTNFQEGGSLEMYSMNKEKYLKCRVTDANGNFCERYTIDGVLKYEKIRKTYENNVIYEGYAAEGIPNGIGEITYKNGTSCKGIFIDGILSKENKIICINNSDIYSEESIDN